MLALLDLLHGPAAFALLAVAVLGLAAAVVLVRRRRSARPVVFLPRSAAPVAQAPAPGTTGADVIQLLNPLRVGQSIDGFHIHAIYEDDDGCVPVLLESAEGLRFRVDVLRRSDGDPSPLATTPTLALYLCGVRGGSPTPETCVRGIRALALALSETAAKPPPWLLSMRQRTRLLENRRPRDS